MTKQNHPITPPPDLVRQWAKWKAGDKDPEGRLFRIANGAAQWGADQELEACCEWMADETPIGYINALRAARRPKPPSLKEQALEALDSCSCDEGDSWKLIRRALEQLSDD